MERIASDNCEMGVFLRRIKVKFRVDPFAREVWVKFVVVC